MGNFYYVTLYYGDDGDGEYHTEVFIMPSDYCEPIVICAFVISSKANYATCDKYGCRKFNPWPGRCCPESLNDYFSMLTNNKLVYGKTL